LKLEERRMMPCTSYPFSNNNSVRYDPSCPVLIKSDAPKRAYWQNRRKTANKRKRILDLNYGSRVQKTARANLTQT
jgi:hypothetical protein